MAIIPPKEKRTASALDYYVPLRAKAGTDRMAVVALVLVVPLLPFAAIMLGSSTRKHSAVEATVPLWLPLAVLCFAFGLRSRQLNLLRGLRPAWQAYTAIIAGSGVAIGGALILLFGR
jgi:hypothetical protein